MRKWFLTYTHKQRRESDRHLTIRAISLEDADRQCRRGSVELHAMMPADMRAPMGADWKLTTWGAGP